MSQRVDVDSGGEIAHGSSTNREHSVGSVFPQEDIHRSGERNAKE